MKSTWTQNEIKILFNLVEKHKKENKPIIDAFYEHAKNSTRQPLSVRNFYYAKVDEIKQNQNLQNQLKINIGLHEKNNYAKFDERQTQKLLEHIKKRTKQGQSIRSACLELAKGDAKQLLRFQNKYREIIKNQTTILQKNAKKHDKNAKNTEKNEFFSKKIILDKKIDIQNCSKNVISFPVEQKLIPQHLSEAEIQSLFVGLAKLIKKSALAEMEEKINLEREKISVMIRRSTIEIGQKAEKIDELLSENEKLSKQIIALKQKLEEMRSSYVKI